MPLEKPTPIQRQILDMIELRLSEQKEETRSLRQRIEAQEQLIATQAMELLSLRKSQEADRAEIARLMTVSQSLNATLSGLRGLMATLQSSTP